MSGRSRRARPRRADLSQHFLRRASAARLVHLTTIAPTDLVIEIGAGRGALTEPLARKAANVVAVEVDPYLANRLRANSHSNVVVAEGDFVEHELPSQPYRILGNIPYAGSAAIVDRLTEVTIPPLDAWLVVQKEFAYRLCGRPYTRESLASLRLKPHWHLAIIDRLKRTEFDPPPTVESVFLHLFHRGRPILEADDLHAYQKLIEHAFRRNGTIAEALRPALSKVQIRRLATDLCFHPADRPADLEFAQWLGVFDFVKRVGRAVFD